MFKFWDEEHEEDSLDCHECIYGYPVRCVCGGLIHGEPDGPYGEDTVLIEECDECGDDWEFATGKD